MSIEVESHVGIKRPRAEVAAYAMDPANAPIWISGIVEARMVSEPPFGKGSQVERAATFLGKRIEYVNEVVEYDPDRVLRMRSVKGPFPMRIRYDFEDSADGTMASIRVEGEASGFYWLAGPLLSRAVKRSITNRPREPEKFAGIRRRRTLIPPQTHRGRQDGLSPSRPKPPRRSSSPRCPTIHGCTPGQCSAT